MGCFISAVDSEDYSMDSEDYSMDSEDYSMDSEDHSPGEDSAETAPWWRKAGYASLEEVAEEQDRLWESWGYRTRAAPAEMPQTVLPEARVPPRGRTRDPRARQVNIRLLVETYEELERVAEDYGVTTTTMARMLVSNGVLLARRSREG